MSTPENFRKTILRFWLFKYCKIRLNGHFCLLQRIYSHDNATNIDHNTMRFIIFIPPYGCASIQLFISLISILFVFSGDFTSTLVIIKKLISHSLVMLNNLLNSSLSFSLSLLWDQLPRLSHSTNLYF